MEGKIWLLARRSWTSLHRITFGHAGTFAQATAGSGDFRIAKLRQRGVQICGRSNFAKENFPQ